MKYDAIVVLGNLMDSEGNLNAETAARVTKAVDLFKAGIAPIIVSCGWAYRSDSAICIADAMVRHSVERLGVAFSDFLVERNSRDTVGDAVFSKVHFYNPRSWSDVLVVTSDYHAKRTSLIFSFVYGRPIKVVSAASGSSREIRDHEAASMRAFEDTFSGVRPGDDRAIVKRLVSQHPFYNGSTYPVADSIDFLAK